MIRTMIGSNSSLRTPSATRKRVEIDENASKITWKSTHTYTKESHENLLRSLTQGELCELRKENNKLRKQVKQAEEASQMKQTRIEQLQRELISLEKTGRNKVEVYRRQMEERAVKCRLVSGDLLTSHFSEVIRRHDRVLANKDARIRELQQALVECRHHRDRDVGVGENHRGERQLRDHVYDGPDRPRSRSSEQLRRTEAAVRAFNDSLDLVKTQLRSAPAEERYRAARGSRSELVIQELGRRRHWGALADVERLTDCFVRRLQVEERLDRHYYRLEAHRLAVYRESAGDECDPRCTYIKGYEQLEITRHNLLKALADMRANRAAHTDKKVHSQNILSQSGDPEPSLATIQTLYNYPEKDKMADSSGSELDSHT